MVNLYMFARLRVLAEYDRLCANERFLVPLPRKMKANVLRRGLLCIISDYAVDPVATIPAFARCDKTDWTAPDCVGGLFMTSQIRRLFPFLNGRPKL